MFQMSINTNNLIFVALTVFIFTNSECMTQIIRRRILKGFIYGHCTLKNSICNTEKAKNCLNDCVKQMLKILLRRRIAVITNDF